MLANMNPELWSTGSVPTVSPNDIAVLLDKRSQFLKEFGEQPTVVDPRFFGQACDPNTDVTAAWYRTSMLGLLQRGGLLPSDLSTKLRALFSSLLPLFQ